MAEIPRHVEMDLADARKAIEDALEKKPVERARFAPMQLSRLVHEIEALYEKLEEEKWATLCKKCNGTGIVYERPH